MLFSPKALLFKRLLINLLIFSIKIMGLILNAFILILLKFTILILEKNLVVKISIFIVLLFIKKSLINLLRFNK